MAKQVQNDVGPVDILINNAGIVIGKNILDLTDEQIQKTMMVNVISHFFIIRAFLPKMIERKSGHIVTIASLAGELGAAMLTDYCASKFAAVGMEQSLKLELAKANLDGQIKTTVVKPWLISTGMFNGFDPGFIPPLNPEYVARKIIEAILLDQPVVIVPWYLEFLMNLEDIYSSDPVVCYEAVRRLKNCVIGSNRLKGLVLEQNVSERLVELMRWTKFNPEINREAMLAITSLAKGTEQHLKMVIDAEAVPQLLQNTRAEKFELVEASLRGLRTIFKSRLAPIDLIYQTANNSNTSFIDQPSSSSSSKTTDTTNKLYQNSILAHLFTLARRNISPSNYVIKECIANILASSCQSNEHQNIMKDLGAIQIIASFLHPDNRNAYQVKLAALNWLAQLCFENESVSLLVTQEVYSGQSLLDMLFDLMSALHTFEMQFYSAKCMTYIYRSKAMDSQDKRLLYRCLPTLIYLCKKDKEASLRAQAAEELAYLIDVDVSLQKTASICDHLINSLADMLRQSSNLFFANSSRNTIPVAGDNSRKSSITSDNIATMTTMLIDEPMDTTMLSSSSPISPPICNVSVVASSNVAENGETNAVKNELRQAAFKVFASLGANDEDIRKRIIETKNLMDEVMNGLEDSNLKVKLAALRCLHSMSRSVQQLRTMFQDHAVWLPLRTLLQSPTYEIIMLASSVLCNLLLEFSPSKQVNHFLDRFAIELLCDLTKRDDVQLRLNGAWALMNMAYQADEDLKTQILNCLGTDQIFRLLSDSDVNILMKTLGLLRNLLSTKPHIDLIMQQHGKQIMQAVILILEGEHPWEVKEQALCILVNIADGNKAKEFIMSNEDVLNKLISYLLNSNVNLQKSAVFCIINLVWHENENSAIRQEKLIELSVPKILQQLLQQTQNSSQHATLYGKVKTALDEFNHFNNINK
ncbi:hypothetical protein BLA29_000927 [Euroglyphus maynei]|uniref:Armadillo repeat-containing protein 8 n=1 Tax=Euroglyphus maynei TaxID=6958 RepID=A0A1Y3BBW7_EURMA|nr:hypothetical protein BLA29_000927 [Euroglyphus maynei]